jgi:hypothetical protein
MSDTNTSADDFDIEFVIHAWAGQTPIYATLLHFQLSSLYFAAFKEVQRVCVSVCCSAKDEAVMDVLYRFSSLPGRKFHLNMVQLEEEYLFQRAYGRNHCALRNNAKVVWFTDCDYLFEQEALSDVLRASEEITTNLMFPQTVYASRRRESGDEVISLYEKETGPILIMPMDSYKKFHPSEASQDGSTRVGTIAGIKTVGMTMAPQHYGRAIGGIQIVKGSYAREHGYLKGSKFLNAMPVDEGFRKCRCDTRFRKRCKTSQPVDIKGVSRIRHSIAGRNLPNL